MPANLTPDYLEAEQRFKSAKSTEEKIEALEEMYSTIPKHKGTEKMQGEIKRRLSKLRTSQAKRPTRRIDAMHRVEKEGAGQVALAGPPNSGKSSIVGRLTNAPVKITEFPYGSPLPVPR